MLLHLWSYYHFDSLQQAYRTLDELPLEGESVSNRGTDTTEISNHLELISSMYSTSSSYAASPSTGRRSGRAGGGHQNGYRYYEIQNQFSLLTCDNTFHSFNGSFQVFWNYIMSWQYRKRGQCVDLSY